MNSVKPKTFFLHGTTLVFLAIVFGAFGAHGLKKVLDESHLHTFKTGVDYQMIHGLALLFLGLLKNAYPTMSLNKVFAFILCGLILFSGNCYIYALTDIKIFAMIVPLGGFFFLLAWGLLILKVGKI